MTEITTAYNLLEDKYFDIVKKYATLNENNIEQSLLTHSGVLAFYGAVLAHAKREVDIAEAKFEMESAAFKDNARTECVNSGKKVTDKALEAMVLSNSELDDLRQEYIAAQYKYNLAKNLFTALLHKKDMLVQLSANKRAEMKLIGEE